MPDEIKYVSDEEAAKISRNPDWQCSFCGSLNSDNMDSCRNCGATKDESERNYFEMRKQEEDKKRKKEEKKEEQKASSQKSDSEEPRNSFLKNILILIGTFAAIAFIIFGLVSCFSPKVRNVTIDDFEWKRTIDVEEIVTYDESGWTLPDDARLQYTKREIRSYKNVVDHYKTVSETKTRMVVDHYEDKVSHVDLGNGYFEEKTERAPVYKEETYTEISSEPVYRQEPVYDTKYYYEIDRWTVVDAAKSSGHDQNPSWPELKLKDGQRAGSKKEYYFVTTTYQDKKGKTKTEKYNMDFSEWKKLKKGEEIELKINFNGFAEINNKK